MVLGSHIVFSTYGFWLPNDPRGSWSDFVRSWELYRHGAATKVSTRFSRASHPHDTRARRDTKRALKYPAVRLNGIQARAVGRGFAALANKSRVCVWACSILPEHVHLVIERHRCPAEQLINLLKGQATRELIAEALHPLAAFPTRTGRMPKVFARGHWKVYLDRVDRIHAAIRYVQDNPIKEGKAPQKWSFVRAYGA